jgi:hypothetical protein
MNWQRTSWAALLPMAGGQPDAIIGLAMPDPS